MFYDNPALVEEMIDFWRLFIGDLLKKILQYFTPEEIHISEDMAYKGHSMLSPKMTRQFLQPCWNYWGEIIRNAGIPIYSMDSDGCINELIPIWIESGINVCDPIEAAAGNDIAEFRKRFGHNIAYRGGVDKREMARGGAIDWKRKSNASCRSLRTAAISPAAIMVSRPMFHGRTLFTLSSCWLKPLAGGKNFRVSMTIAEAS